ncbi:MAG: sugar ABC transporter permease [Rhodobacteraceae bacterium]|nr:sugar ABC transporter permease [Paracoccaceae bacterium]
MKHRTFFWFILPTLSAMILFIALPIVSVFIQSLFVEHEQVLVVSESCGPFGCTQTTSIDTEATEALRADSPLGQYNGLGTYFDRSHLATAEVAEIWKASTGLASFVDGIMDLKFYKALVFTLTYTFVVTPAVLILGLAIAVGVNNLPKALRGIAIFISLLPFLVATIVGSMILSWMLDGEGIIGATLQNIFNDPSLTIKSSTPLMWIALIIYGIWHTLPFSFIVFYAGLQTVPGDTLEAAKVDGANKWQTMINVVVPHLMPLVSFVTLMLLMDNFRVFEPIVSFQAEAHAQSLSTFILSDLREAGNPLYASAGATSILTIIGVAILLSPVVVRTWRDFSAKSH